MLQSGGPLRLGTLSLHGADPVDRAIGSPVAAPIVTATSFYTDPEAVGLSPADLGADGPFFYTRWANPTAALLERRIAALEGAEAAVCFASGMAAVAGLFLWRLKAGDHLVLSDICYPGVAEVAHDAMSRLGIAATVTDTSDPVNVAAALRPTTRLVHVETPANPILKLSDIAAIARICRAAGIELSVDSTIATRPIDLGADYVIHSLTKYICGHGDALGGVIATTADKAADLRKEALIHHGAALNPVAAWLIARGLETLPIRLRVHEENARRVADYLSAHSRLDAVYWPGLASHPQYELARRQMRNFSGMIAFTAKDGPALARRLAKRLRVFSYAVSLGKTKSLIFYIQTEPLLRGSFRLASEAADAYRRLAGDGVFRVSVGLEDPADLVADLEQALG